jgi:hypothetical protein
MDTDIANRVITEITSRLGVGYSVFSDAVSQYAKTKATESLIFSAAFFGAAILVIAFAFFVVKITNSQDSVRSSDLDSVLSLCLFLLIILIPLVALGIYNFTGYINWSNAPQGMFLQEIIKSIK